MSWFGFVVGLGLALFTWATVAKTLVFTRVRVPILERGVILGLRRAYTTAARAIPGYERKDDFLSTMAPGALLVQLAVWLALFCAAAALMFWPFVDGGLDEGTRASGSSLFTLGISGPGGYGPTALIFATAATGIVVIALYIAYLPSLYAQFNAREAAVSQLESLIGAPPWGPELLASHQERGLIDGLPALYARWDQLIAEVSVAITHYPLLAWFRGPHPRTSWSTSLLAVLDSAALYAAIAPDTAPVECRTVVHTSAHALENVSRTISFATNSRRGEAVAAALTLEEFLTQYERLKSAGFPVTAGPDESWASFRDRRSLYAPQVLMLADAVLAPPAPWADHPLKV